MHDCVFGLDVLRADGCKRLDGARIGLLANHASVDGGLRPAWHVLNDRWRGQLKALFTPQHGYWGDAQANMIETDHGWDSDLNIPIYSLYSETRRPTIEMLEHIDWLVVDLQDVGTRIYTFVWTLLECMRACSEANVSVLVLDRPNPLGGRVIEGPRLQHEYRSFVGGATLPMRHALTIGEMARLFQREYDLDLELDVLELQDYDVGADWLDLRRIWVPPSPNLPTEASVFLYPGQVLLEGTNLSEGRGTTTPFQVVGAPYLDARRFASRVREWADGSFRVLPTWFRPTFDKWENQTCSGISLHVIQRKAFRSFDVTIQLLQTIHELEPSAFDWLDPPYEYETVKPPIDILFGSDQLRSRLGELPVHELSSPPSVDVYRDWVEPILLYGDGSRFCG